MTAYDGQNVLIEVGDGAFPTESFITLGGLTANAISISNDTIDASNVASGSWRSVISDGGKQSARITGSGVFEDSAAENTLRGYALDAQSHNYRFMFGNGDRLNGPFIITNYERSGEVGSAEDYTITLQSAGALSFNAA